MIVGTIFTMDSWHGGSWQIQMWIVIELELEWVYNCPKHTHTCIPYQNGDQLNRSTAHLKKINSSWSWGPHAAINLILFRSPHTNHIWPNRSLLSHLIVLFLLLFIFQVSIRRPRSWDHDSYFINDFICVEDASEVAMSQII